jgi:hypothetical protein
VFAPWRLVEDFFGAVEKQRPLLRGNHFDLEAVRLCDTSEGLVGAKRLSVHDRVGHDDDAASVAGQEAPHLA